jgi:hypothetical protein
MYQRVSGGILVYPRHPNWRTTSGKKSKVIFLLLEVCARFNYSLAFFSVYVCDFCRMTRYSDYAGNLCQ